MTSSTDIKLGLRMLRKYPGLTIAGGLALAIAIGLGAGWYDFSHDLLRPRLPLPDGNRIVEIEMRDSMKSGDEHRILHDFAGWRRDARSVEQLGAYRTIERSLTLGGVRAASVYVAETTASAFRVARVPPVLGRPLLDADEQPGAPPVVVLGYEVWQRWFRGRADAIGQQAGLGPVVATVVGIMPEGFAFPVNHQAWMPLQLRPAGYAPLEGVPVRVFGMLAPQTTHEQADAEFVTLTERTAAASPQTHRHLRPRVLVYGGESPGSISLELGVRHIPILVVLIIACATVGTLVYARTATREGEIATRSALGASRARIVSQLFAESLVLASIAAVAGLTAAHWVLKWGRAMYYSGRPGPPPFWVESGLHLTTVLYAAGLTLAGAALIGVLPALKATGPGVQAQLRNLGAGGSTLRFGRLWTTAMVGQVALTVFLIPPAMGISGETIRDRLIRGRFPAAQYLAVRLELDRETGPAEESDTAYAARRERTYTELERRLASEAGVAAVTLADRLPGMDPNVSRAEVEVTPGEAPVTVFNMWTAAVGPGFFEAFDRAIVGGRGFRPGDSTDAARPVIVNEAFARRRFMNGVNPIGRRVRFRGPDDAAPGPWFEIVGMVRDIGVTPTDFGEAPYVFQPASAANVAPLVMGVRVRGDRAAVAQRVRAVAADVDPGLRIEDMRPLDDLVWETEIPAMVGAAAIGGIVSLGLFMSAAGIFSLMSVTVARRTREIGLRSALGASSKQVLANIFARAALLVGGGIVAGNALLAILFTLPGNGPGGVPVAFLVRGVMITSGVMLTVGLLACVEPARRALRVDPTDALRQV